MNQNRTFTDADVAIIKARFGRLTRHKRSSDRKVTLANLARDYNVPETTIIRLLTGVLSYGPVDLGRVEGSTELSTSR